VDCRPIARVGRAAIGTSEETTASQDEKPELCNSIILNFLRTEPVRV
jgi:hypothetical protein